MLSWPRGHPEGEIQAFLADKLSPIIETPRLFEFRTDLPKSAAGKILSVQYDTGHLENRERTRAGLASARARGRKGGRRPKMTAAKLRLALASMGKPETNVGALCRELGITRSTLYRHVSPTSEHGADASAALTRSRVRIRSETGHADKQAGITAGKPLTAMPRAKSAVAPYPQ